MSRTGSPEFPRHLSQFVERVNNRDQVYFQSDYPFTPNILGMFSFRYEDERGAKKSASLWDRSDPGSRQLRLHGAN